jgi:hypothetical protein
MPLLDLFWTMFLFFLWVLWFWLLFMIISDIFRSEDLTGWGKAGWLVFAMLTPYLGVFVYLIARGGSMGERQLCAQQQAEQATTAYNREVASKPSTAEELETLARLRASGALTEEEFVAQKATVLGAPPPTRRAPAEPVG